MILIFEQDTRLHNGKRFEWKPMLFRGIWCGGRTWRIGWGMWSISYYPSKGLLDFFRYVESRNAAWYHEP